MDVPRFNIYLTLSFQCSFFKSRELLPIKVTQKISQYPSLVYFFLNCETNPALLTDGCLIHRETTVDVPVCKYAQLIQ